MTPLYQTINGKLNLDLINYVLNKIEFIRAESLYRNIMNGSIPRGFTGYMNEELYYMNKELWP